MRKSYDWADISNHSKPEDLFLVIEGKVYDVTRFQHEHPCTAETVHADPPVWVRSGGDEFLVDQGGQDVTELFNDAGHSDEARAILKTLVIGEVKV
ncbi:unnamed protein product [Clonostachys rhizophaga]|uniref:Cytochrome b5 heme-binding domain-containing protein n=1 Tax=Clonostachys rhizophaga TaxID=160324 RepID=A0A9N9VG80_9HYPO|nr:unnamed protein product [Clonostachys rhizophaga]